MPNIIDYVDASQYDSFYDKEITVLDILALTEITYLPFDQLLPTELSTDNQVALHHLAAQFHQAFQGNYPPLSMVTTNRLNLLEKLANYKRYKHIKASALVNDYSLDSQKQFAAVTYQIRPRTFLVVFRGTDDSLIGWKEDFHMTYMPEIPAQASARDYLSSILSNIQGEVYLAGHSKGGNLAIYAASHVTTALQEQIREIYSFDAPGMHSSLLEQANFKAIEGKIHSIIPQHSIVGMMLEPPQDAIIVKSKAIGLLQHISFHWEIEGDDFKKVGTVTDDSVQVDKTLKSWTARLSDAELKDFFDLFFGIFIEAGIHRFGDITVDTPKKIQKVIQNSQKITPDQEDMMARLIRLLIDTRFQIWKEHLPDLPDLPDFNLQDYLPPELQDTLDNLIPKKTKNHQD